MKYTKETFLRMPCLSTARHLLRDHTWGAPGTHSDIQPRYADHCSGNMSDEHYNVLPRFNKHTISGIGDTGDLASELCDTHPVNNIFLD